MKTNPSFLRFGDKRDLLFEINGQLKKVYVSNALEIVLVVLSVNLSYIAMQKCFEPREEVEKCELLIYRQTVEQNDLD